MKKIVTDENFLVNNCKPVSLEEGEKIATELFQVLAKESTGVGLAANQIGIDARVCVINVKEPIYLINPEYIETQGEIIFNEACLSYPGKQVRTKRFHTVIVKADNFEAPVCFTSLTNNPDDTLECVAAQHEISHLNGETMWDYEYKQTPIVSKKIGRNERVKISNGSEVQELKWKKAQPLVESGEWELV